jgi:alkaline phosphatase D
MQYIDNPAILSQKLESFELEVSTVDANDGESIDLHFVNIVFSDRTRLFEPENLPLYTVSGFPPRIVGTLPGRGDTRRYKLPFKDAFPNDRPLDRILGEIAEVFIRKGDDDN